MGQSGVTAISVRVSSQMEIMDAESNWAGLPKIAVTDGEQYCLIPNSEAELQVWIQFHLWT